MPGACSNFGGGPVCTWNTSTSMAMVVLAGGDGYVLQKNEDSNPSMQLLCVSMYMDRMYTFSALAPWLCLH